MKEFKVNEYITLKLENRRTFIYIKGERFMQCIRLTLSIPKRDLGLYDDVDSIDESAELFKTLHENKIIEGNESHSITPEQEFWGHCSNIQAWVEHNYDTRILHSNLAFPLLKRLAEHGIAKMVFMEEVAKRLESGQISVIYFLVTNGYLNYLDEENKNLMLYNPNPEILVPIIKKIEDGDISIFRSINLLNLLDSLKNDYWKDIFCKLNPDTSNAILFFTSAFKHELMMPNITIGQLDPLMHKVMLRSYTNKYKERQIVDFTKDLNKNLTRYPEALDYWLGRLVIQYYEEHGIEHLLYNNNRKMREAINYFLRVSDIQTIIFSSFLRYLIDKGDSGVDSAFKDEVITRFLINPKDAEFLEITRSMEYINAREITAKIIELIRKEDINILSKLLKYNDLSIYLDKEALNSLQDKNIIDSINNIFNRGDISSENLIQLYRKLPQFSSFIQNTTEENKKRYIKIVWDSLRSRKFSSIEQGIVFFQIFRALFDQEEIALVINEILKHEKIVKEIITPAHYRLLEDDFFNSLRLELLIDFLKNDNYNYIYISRNKAKFLSILWKIKFIIKGENLKEKKIIKDEIVKRIRGEDINLIADLFDSEYLTFYLNIDDIREIIDDLNNNIEDKLIKILEMRKGFEWKILILYLIIKEKHAFDILYFLLYDLLNNPESELNKRFFNESLLEDLKKILISEVKEMKILEKTHLKVLNLILEKFKEQKRRNPYEFGLDLLKPAFISIVPKGIKELFESIDYRLYNKLGWEYDEYIINPILREIRKLYPEDFKKSLFEFIEKYGFDNEKFGYYHRDYVNELNRDDFWKLISSGKEFLFDLEREIDKKLYILNNDEEPRDPGFIIKNGQIEELLIWEVNLQQLPESIGNLRNLKRIHISSTPLSSLPESFKNLDSLEDLDLCYNNFSTLPEVVGTLKSLKTILMDGNPIKTLPESIGNLEQLQSIRIFENLLEKLPDSIGNLKNLRSLDISNNHKNTIKYLPDTICNLENLSSLNLFGCKIEALPSSFGNLKNLEYLKLNSTNIKMLPESMKHLMNLKELELSNTKIENIPSWISNLKSLRKLELGHLKLKEIPPEFNQLTNLQDLDLKFNQITEIENISNLTKLYCLNLDGNQIHEIKGLEGLFKLKILELCRNKISEIKGLEALQRLDRFSIGGNPIDDSLFNQLGGVETSSWPYLAKNPYNFVKYSRDKIQDPSRKYVEINGDKYYVYKNRLDLYNTRIGSIKQIFGLENLTELEILILRKNHVKDLDELNFLKNLKILDLANNRISEIKGLEELVNLEVLNFNENFTISEIKGLDNLTKLKELNLMRNKITEIKGLDNLKNLEVLNLSYNEIYEIKNLKALRKLKYLNLSNNKIHEMKGLDELVNLEILVIGRNEIPNLKFENSELKYTIKEYDYTYKDLY